MKLIYFLILSFISLPVFSQSGQGYIIKLNYDTVHLKTIKIDRKKKKANCEDYKGKKVGFMAENVLVAKIDSSIYETGLVRLKKLKRKRFVFLQNTISGDLNLYEFGIKRTKLSWRTVGENIITLRWIYRARDARIKYYTSIFFYKKKNESREELSRQWKTKTKDCKLLEDKINSKVNIWKPGPRELVLFYNLNCN